MVIIQKLKMLFRLSKIYKLRKLQKKWRLQYKRLWCRQWLLRRNMRQLGACEFVENELTIEDPVSFKNYVRMSKDDFEQLHSILEFKICKQDTRMRQCITSRSRLIVTLRYLATGESYKSLSYSTRISVSAIAVIVPEVCNAIYECLQAEYLKVPSTVEEWKNISKEYLDLWNIPNTLGALDGKHIVFRAPQSAGSHYYNYKGTHSIVLLAVADARYNFLYIDVGANGRNSDGGIFCFSICYYIFFYVCILVEVFSNCTLSSALKNNLLNLPNNEPLPGMDVSVPYVFVADAAFPLQEHIMKPYPFRNMTREERIFNYRISRARRVIENSFGILVNRFRILLNPINLCRDKVVTITQACYVLHNYLRLGAEYSAKPTEIVHDSLRNVTFQRGRASYQVLHIREVFKNYFNVVNILQWQENMA